MKPITFDIRRMIRLRVKGWNYSQLGREFHKDHTTILYHCQRLGIVPHVRITKEVKEHKFIIREPDEEETPTVAPKYVHLLEEERVNPGKTYAEYLAESLTRPAEKRYHEIYYGYHPGPIIGGFALPSLLEEEARSESDTIDPPMVP